MMYMSNPNSEMVKVSDELLKAVPDFTSWQEAAIWLQQGQLAAKQWTSDVLVDAQITSLQINERTEFPFGLYASEKWRKFVLATFLADLICYSNPVDQVSFERLIFVMHSFSQGFRTWWIKLPNQNWWPVGYTGWYPMLETAFETFKNNPEKLTSRMVVPTQLNKEKPLLYLFNCSVAPQLKQKILTKPLMSAFAQDISKQNPKALACITVSDDGSRVAKRFGMTCRGYLTIDGCAEGVFVGEN